MRYLTGGSPTLRERIEKEVLPHFLELHARDSNVGFWAAVEKESGRFIGWFHLRPAEDSLPGETELGYRLRRDAWGKGYATEGSRALVRKAFEDLGWECVTAWTMVVNTRSRRVMEKAGLRLVKTVYRPWPYGFEGTEQGDVEYAIDREEWRPPPDQ
jgi:RimJ/RimL family protein N-acetyltransferase